MKKSIKAMLSILLALALSMPVISWTGDTLAVEAGETVEVEFTVLQDSGAVSAATLELQYDHEALELVPNRSFESFERDTKVYFYGLQLKAAFRVRENAAPGNYPVTLKIIDASDANGEIVPDPETKLVFSEANVTVERAPAEVPVYYITGDGSIVATDSVMLPAGQTTGVNAEAPGGWTVVGGQSIPVTVTEEGQAIPSSVIFWLATPAPTVPVLQPANGPTPRPVKAGEYVKFGHYPQTAAGNDSTEIEWLVLEVRGNEALLLSKYGLDAQPYNMRYADATWENCFLRDWLNAEFLEKAFTSQECMGILMTNVLNDKSQCFSGWGTSGGNNTEDRIFLLSYAEANKYLGVTNGDSENIISRVEATEYAKEQGALANSSNKTAAGTAAGWWWLRSPGSSRDYAAGVFSGGSLSGYSINNDSGCVRPALWVDLGSIIF